jgi:hypothetical protein
VQPHVEHPDQFVRQVLREQLDPDATTIEIEDPGEESAEPEE